MKDKPKKVIARKPIENKAKICKNMKVDLNNAKAFYDGKNAGLSIDWMASMANVAKYRAVYEINVYKKHLELLANPIVKIKCKKFKPVKYTIDILKTMSGNWEILKEIPERSINGVYTRLVECKCVCGKIKNVHVQHIIKKTSQSCGCCKKSIKTHGLSKHTLFYVWQSMRARCYNKNRPRYNDWGGRGITVCDLWNNDFKSFYDWAISNGYVKGLQIDRINNDGNYEPDNCRWATAKENSNNRRR